MNLPHRKYLRNGDKNLCNGDCIAVNGASHCGGVCTNRAKNCTVCSKYVSYICAKVDMDNDAPRRHPKCVPPSDAPVVDVDAIPTEDQPPPPEHPLCNGVCANMPTQCGDDLQYADVLKCFICHTYVSHLCAKISAGGKTPRRHPKCVPPPEHPLCNGDCTADSLSRCGRTVVGHGNPHLNCVVCHTYVNWKCAGAEPHSDAPRRHPKCVPPPPPEHPLCNGDCANTIAGLCDSNRSCDFVQKCTVCRTYVNNHCANVPGGDTAPRRHPKCAPPQRCEGLCRTTDDGEILCATKTDAVAKANCAVCHTFIDKQCVRTTDVPATPYRHPRCKMPPLAPQLKKRACAARHASHDMLMTIIRRNLRRAAGSGKTWIDQDSLTQAAIDELRDEDRFTIQNIVAMSGKDDRFAVRIVW